ncbi:MAG: ROK family protein [Myxococcales bacterium]|nr:ROK family protein [Myxococcota bacterium]MDW8280377.1 ROK family protein [Myxococcales bacterium]
MEPGLRLGVDLGGTKIEAAVVRLDGGAVEVLARRRVPTEQHRGYEHIVAAVVRIIQDTARQAHLPALPPVGVGMPGSVTQGAGSSGPLLVKNSNTQCLNGRPFRDDLQRALGHPVAFANDANCFALAEARCGAGRGCRVVFGVILGTGVGGGIVLEGRIWEGAQGIAGEWGHVVLDPSGPPCYCGRRGCVERYLSGPAIEQAYAARTGVHRPLHEIAARADDPAARATLATTTETFGRALATVINILDPEIVVLGGGVSNLPQLYDEGVAAVRRWVFNDRLQTAIVRHQLGDSAGVFGAALLPEPALRPPALS